MVPPVHPSPQPNGISISSAVLAGLTSVTDRPTDRPCYSVGNNRPHLRTLYGQCSLIIITRGQSNLTKARTGITHGWFTGIQQVASPPNTFPCDHRVSMRNSITIASANFAQLTAKCSYTLQWAAILHLKITPSYGGIWTPI